MRSLQLGLLKALHASGLHPQKQRQKDDDLHRNQRRGKTVFITIIRRLHTATRRFRIT